MLFCAVSRRVSRASIRLHDGRRPRPSGDPRHDRRSDRQRTGCLLVWPAYRSRGHESFLPAERLSSPGPQARESRSPRIGLSWPAEEGHLSSPLLSWQLCLFPQGWVYPAGAAACCLGTRIVCLTGIGGRGCTACGGPDDTPLPGQRSYRQKDQMTKTPAPSAYHHLS